MMESAQMPRRRRGLKICCSVTVIIIFTIVIISVVLAFTVFKAKDPEISARAVGIQNIQLSLFPNLSVNATLDMEVTIKNPNYGSFEFGNTTANVNYHGDIVAKFPLESRNVPAKGQVKLRALVNVMGNKLVSNPFFTGDVGIGTFNFTADSELHGKVRVWNVIKFKATAYSTCDIYVFIETQKVISNCKSSIKV